jgi:hypothetical protein
LIATATYLAKPRFEDSAVACLLLSAAFCCLQNRLNELDENFAIEIREW